MADRMGNIAGLFKEGRTRTILLTTVIVLVIAIAAGFFIMRGRTTGIEAAAGLAQVPGGIQNVPFQTNPNPEYARTQERQNIEAARAAEQTGGSAIPTIIRAETMTGPAETSTSIGYTALSREQSEAGTFSPKEFTAGQKGAPAVICPTVPPVSVLGTPVYDKNGRLIGYAGADGKVRDTNGNIIGTLGPDGLVRDANGVVIGQKGSAISGTPVYDDKCNIIGYVEPDGDVRDASGRVEGTVGPDGTVRNPSGKIIGHAAVPVYDPNGKLLGYSCADGKIRDANGNIIGTVGPDGVARDLNGNIIGRAGAISPGTPVYDANGNIIGYVGPDGKVRDANGNIIGTMGVDGLLRDAKDNIIGSIVKPQAPAAAEAPLGTPIYDANGNLIGYAGSDGKVRDLNGKIIGTLGTDGKVRDAQGNIIGSTEKQKMTPEEIAAQNLQISYQRQQEILKDQRLAQEVQQKQTAMSSQANQLMAAWTQLSTQQYVAGEKKEESASGGEGASASGGTSGQGAGKAGGQIFIKAGTVYFGIINTAINSDEPGPVMATILNGPYKGGKLLGSLTNQGKAVLITFNTMSLPQFSKSISIQAVAIDQNTARTALSTETDNHYLLRYGSLFAASFVQGYGQAIMTSGTTTTASIGPGGAAVQTSVPPLSPKDKFFAALGNIGTQWGTQMNAVYNTPPTVYVASGTAVGVLFMSDVPVPAS